MMYLAIVPNRCISILYNKIHSFHYIDESFTLGVFKQYRYVKAKCVIIDNGSVFEIGRWTGILDVLGWKYELIDSDEWMRYFGLWPEDPSLVDDHWMNVVKYRYPMLPVKPDNYEPILAACYLHDKDNNESVGAFV